MPRRLSATRRPRLPARSGRHGPGRRLTSLCSLQPHNPYRDQTPHLHGRRGARVVTSRLLLFHRSKREWKSGIAQSGNGIHFESFFISYMQIFFESRKLAAEQDTCDFLTIYIFSFRINRECENAKISRILVVVRSGRSVRHKINCFTSSGNLCPYLFGKSAQITRTG